jgi:hypothetical protein
VTGTATTRNQKPSFQALRDEGSAILWDGCNVTRSGTRGGEPLPLVPLRNNCGQAPADTVLNDPFRLAERRMAWRISAALRSFSDTREDAFHLADCAYTRAGGVLPDGRHVTEAVFLCRHPLCPSCRRRRAVAWHRRVAPFLAQGGEWLPVDGNGQVVPWEVLDTDGVLEPGQLPLNGVQIRGRKDDDRLDHQAAAEVQLDVTAGRGHLLTRNLERLERASEIHFERLFPLFITLTIPNLPVLYEESDGRAVNWLDEKLWKPWRTMRETARRRPHSRAGRLMGLFAGGVWVTEVTYNPRTQTFHPHIHAIVWSRRPFVHKLALQRVWGHYAPGAEIVDVRAVTTALANDLMKDVGDERRGTFAVVAYLLGGMVKEGSTARNTSKASKERHYPKEYWWQVLHAIKGRRLVNTFGCLRGLPEPDLYDGMDGAETQGRAEEIRAQQQQQCGAELGMHYLARWDGKTQRYRVLLVWPESADDPIKPMGQRLREGQAVVAALRAWEREQAGQTLPEYVPRDRLAVLRWKYLLESGGTGLFSSSGKKA